MSNRTADARVCTSSAEFVAPAGWALARAPDVATLTAPEGDTRIAIVNVGVAANAEDAAASAWRRLTGRPLRKVRMTAPGAPRDGWDERVSITYETSPNEKVVMFAFAVRRADAWTVAVLDGTAAVFDKRQAAFALVLESLLPAGFQKENFAGKAAHPLTPERIRLMTDFVASAMQELEVPGAGVAFIDKGRVVYQGGIGVKTFGSSDAVDADTRFMIASNTKGMATLLLATLADEGRLQWDQPVTELYPSFRLGDDATTHATLVRHLVCAGTGLPRKDLEWILTTTPQTPASDTFRQLAATQPTSRFGEIFQYNNLMASAAGYLGGILAYPGTEMGAAFDRAMDERIFRPLGMANTTFSFAEALAGNHADPHAMGIDGRVVRVNQHLNYAIIPFRPAGGAWSSAADMARYVQLELGRGTTPDGEHLVSEVNLLQRRKRGVAIGQDAWYGMGLMEDQAWGVQVIHHGGAMFGYKSDWIALPDAGIGAVILTNSDEGRALLRPFMRRLLEVLYDGRPEAMAEVGAAANSYRTQMSSLRGRVTLPPDPMITAALARTYHNSEMGLLTTRQEGERTLVKMGVLESPVATRRTDDGTISLITVEPGVVGLFEMVAGQVNEARTLTLRDGQHEYVYTEVP